MYSKPNLKSSFRAHDLGRTLYNTVVGKRPNLCLEFGVLNGYSTVAIGQALSDIGNGVLFSYDLWDSYKFKHGSKQELAMTLAKSPLYKNVHLRDGDLMQMQELPDFDFMFVDISNTGDVIRHVEKITRKQREKGALVMFEGGTKERDSVPWMVQYKKPKIVGCGVDYLVVDNRFPSLSIII